MFKKFTVTLFVMVITLYVGEALAAYEMTELQGLGGPSQATSINDLGQAVGTSAFYDYACPYAVLWGADGSVARLGTVNSKELSSFPAGINNRGVIIGSRAVKASSCDTGIFQAYVIVPMDTNKDGMPDTWYLDSNGDGINDLMTDVFPGDPNSSFLTGINDAGQVVGYLRDSYGRTFAFVITPYDKNGDGIPDSWSEKGGVTITNLELNYAAETSGINNRGEVVGTVKDKDLTYGVIWSAATGKIVYKTHLLGRDINDLGLIAGSLDGVASLDDNGSLVTIGTLGGKMSEATSVNNAGQTVGRSMDASGNPEAWRAFLWRDRQLLDLGAFGDGYSEASSINNAGQIVGRSMAKGDMVRAVLWTEVKTPEEQVQTIATDLNTLVQEGAISPGDGTALTATLTAATQKLAQGNTTAACNTLHAFVNQTNAKVKSGKLSADQGKTLVDSAGSVSACK
jgi:probable HAF family extracellular repeat protein